MAGAQAVTREEVLAEIKLKRENNEWLNEHREELRKKFPNHYIAIYGKRVAAKDEEFENVLSILRDLSDKAPAIAAIEFISKEQTIWML